MSNKTKIVLHTSPPIAVAIPALPAAGKRMVATVVSQSSGHPVLTMASVNLDASRSRPAELEWDRNPGTHQIGWFDRIKPTLGKADAIKTPPAFSAALLSLARASRA